MNTSYLWQLRNKGLDVRLVAGEIRIGPADRVTGAILQEARLHKDELRVEVEAEARLPKPYINERRELIIPWNSARKYHYWNGGQSLADTLRELRADEGIFRRYAPSVLQDIGGNNARRRNAEAGFGSKGNTNGLGE